jgi:hypothetical protein
MNRILLCWLGSADLKAARAHAAAGVGPVAQALDTGRFARLDCSATRKAPSPSPSAPAWASSRPPTPARSFSMRSARCRSPPRSASCAPFQEGEITRVGATQPTRVDVRIIAATNRSKRWS